MSLQKEKQKTEHTPWARCARLGQRETGPMEEGTGQPRCQGHINTRSVRHFLLSPQKIPSVASAFSDPQKRQNNSHPSPPKQRQNALLFAHPLLKTKYSKKILSQYLQTHPLWATFSLLWRGDKMLSSDSPCWGDKGKTSEGQEDPHPGVWGEPLSTRPLGA